ncbi:MAG: tetratricopeptide repeat protein, partial [Candidatus Hydrogenedentes bacterium]|nr:tetratricopeptide repeat protein [Candidatus Hydrogenedentota bacterium]
MDTIQSRRTGVVTHALLLVSVGAVCLFPLISGSEKLSPGEDNLFEAANLAYESNDFAGAAEKYKQVRDAGIDSGEVLYNLGNCYFRMGRAGMAMVYYERARKFIPRNRNLLANIVLTESRAVDKITPLKVWVVARKLFFWHHRLTAREIALIFIAANAAFWASVATLAIARNRFVRIAVVLMGIILVLSGVSYTLSEIESRGLGTAVVVADEAAVQTGPGNYAVTFKLHDGTRLKLVDSREGWYQIRLADGKRGWIEA